MIQITNEDCMDLMARYPDKFFQLAIVDPPYGIGVNHNMGRRRGDEPSPYKKIKWDSTPPDKKFFNELERVSQYRIIFGANHFISRMPYDSPCWIVWDKLFSEDLSFASAELAWTNFPKVTKQIHLSSSQPDRIHPTQKPIRLYKKLLSMYAEPGWRILDTHIGSGSIALACHDLGFDLVGCEIDSEYFSAAMERIKTYQLQGQLFNSENIQIAGGGRSRRPIPMRAA